MNIEKYVPVLEKIPYFHVKVVVGYFYGNII